MSHEITIRQDGTVEAAYALLPAWHGLGTVVDHCMTSEEVFKAAHLDWTVEQWPIEAKNPFGYRDAPDNVPVPNHKANVRSDNHAVLGVVTNAYEVVNNVEAFNFVDALHQDGIIKYESAGSLKGGRVVWLLARMPQEFKITEQDILKQYILFTTAHDGSRAIRVVPTDVRVVCWNTVSLAIADERRGLSIRHMGNIQDKLADAKRAITAVNEEFDQYHKTVAALRDVRFNMKRMESFVNVLIPAENGVNDTQRQRTRNAILDAFTAGPQNLPEVRGTAWAGFNAVTQTVDHLSVYRGRGANSPAENRMFSTMLGSNARFKLSALALMSQAAMVA